MTLRVPFALSFVAVLCAPNLQGQDKILSTSYYPLKVGSAWIYASGEQQVTIQVEKFEVLDVPNLGKTHCARLLVNSGDRKLTEHVAVLKDGVYRFTSADKMISPGLRFLMLDTKGANTWQVDATTDGTKLKGTFTLGSETIAVPYFKGEKRVTLTAACAEFQAGTSTMSITYWFAENIGMVKQRVQVGNFDQILELVDYRTEKK